MGNEELYMAGRNADIIASITTAHNFSSLRPARPSAKVNWEAGKTLGSSGFRVCSRREVRGCCQCGEDNDVNSDTKHGVQGGFRVLAQHLLWDQRKPRTQLKPDAPMTTRMPTPRKSECKADHTYTIISNQ